MSLVCWCYYVRKFSIKLEITSTQNMSWFEGIPLFIVILLGITYKLAYISCSNFELVSMAASSSIIILPGEVIDTVSAGHWTQCASKCGELEAPSACNTIQFDQTTKNCLLAYKDVAQNICSSISKRSIGSLATRRKRSEISSFPSQVFILKSFLPIGEFIWKILDDLERRE